MRRLRLLLGCLTLIVTLGLFASTTSAANDLYDFSVQGPNDAGPNTVISVANTTQPIITVTPSFDSTGGDVIQYDTISLNINSSLKTTWSGMDGLTSFNPSSYSWDLCAANGTNVRGDYAFTLTGTNSSSTDLLASKTITVTDNYFCNFSVIGDGPGGGTGSGTGSGSGAGSGTGTGGSGSKGSGGTGTTGSGGSTAAPAIAPFTPFSFVLPDFSKLTGISVGLLSGTFWGIIIQYFLVAASLFATVAVIWSGIAYSLSFGDQAKAEKAKKTFMWAIVGVVVLLMSVAIIGIVSRIAHFVT